MELLYDSNINIKLAAIDAIVKVTDILSVDFKKNRMTTVFLELMNSINEDVMRKMSFHIGAIVYKVLFIPFRVVLKGNLVRRCHAQKFKSINTNAEYL